MFAHRSSHRNALIPANELVCSGALMMSSSGRQRRYYAALCAGGRGARLSHTLRKELLKSFFGRITFSDVRGNARVLKSGLLPAALQMPGLERSAIVWAPEEERRKQWLEI